MSYSLRTDAPVKDTNEYPTLSRATKAAKVLSNITCQEVWMVDNETGNEIGRVYNAWRDKLGHLHRQRTFIYDKEG